MKKVEMQKYYCTTSGETLSPDEVQYLRHLLNKLDSSKVASSSYVPTSIAFNVNLNFWIIEFGANGDMTGSTKGFQNYSTSREGDYVKIANGSCLWDRFNIIHSSVYLSFLFTCYLLAPLPGS